jgi:hypothetical protein
LRFQRNPSSYYLTIRGLIDQVLLKFSSQRDVFAICLLGFYCSQLTPRPLFKAADKLMKESKTEASVYD